MEITMQATKEDYLEFANIALFGKKKLARRHPYLTIVLMFLLLGILAVLLVGGKLLPEGPLLYVVCGILFFAVSAYALLFIQVVRTRSAYVKIHQKRAGQLLTIWLTEEGITTAKDNGTQKMFFAWAAVEQLIVSPNLYIFVMEGGTRVFFNKKYVQGQEPWLMQMVGQAMPGRPVMYF